MPDPETNTLYYGDCLDWMQQWPDECVDLVYLDPPFNSNANYNIIFGTENGTPAQVRGFVDTWKWDDAAHERSEMLEAAIGHPMHEAAVALKTLLGPSGMLSYLTYMGIRLVEIRRLLKPTGNLLLHCDDTAGHYLKILMDALFGGATFRNDVIWRRSTSHNDANRFGRVLDHVLFYGKQRAGYWAGEELAKELSDAAVIKKYPAIDEYGRYRSGDITAAGQRRGDSGRPWRTYDIDARGRHWAVPKTSAYAAFIERRFIPGYRQIKNLHDRLDALDEAGLIHHPSDGFWPGLKRYAAADSGSLPQNLILDPIGFTNFTAPRGEYLGFRTQKPVGLLDQLIRATCPPSGFVLDPFCGCGTAPVAAEQLGRQWAGIDISSFAVELVQERRLRPAGVQSRTEGIPQDLAGARKLASERPFDFETWAVQRVGGMAPNDRQVGDRGIDGRGLIQGRAENWDTRLVLAQVKGGRFQLDQVRAFLSRVQAENAALAIYITLDPVTSPSALSEARELGHIQIGSRRFRRVQFWSIQDYFAGIQPDLPALTDPYTGKPFEPILFSQQHRLGI